MKNKFVALSTLVPMAFAISSFEAFSDPEAERNQAFTELGALIETSETLGEQTSASSKRALEQFNNLQSMFKDVVADHEKTKNAHASTQAALEAEKREKAKVQANLKTKESQLKKARDERDVAVTKKSEQENQYKKLELKHSALKEEQKHHEAEKNKLSQEMANMRARIGDALETVDSNVESIKEEVKKIESSAGVSNEVKESCTNISVIIENIDESLAEEKKDLLQLRKDAAELEAKKAQDEAEYSE